MLSSPTWLARAVASSAPAGRRTPELVALVPSRFAASPCGPRRAASTPRAQTLRRLPTATRTSARAREGCAIGIAVDAGSVPSAISNSARGARRAGSAPRARRPLQCARIAPTARRLCAVTPLFTSGRQRVRRADCAAPRCAQRRGAARAATAGPIWPACSPLRAPPPFPQPARDPLTWRRGQPALRRRRGARQRRGRKRERARGAPYRHTA